MRGCKFRKVDGWMVNVHNELAVPPSLQLPPRTVQPHQFASLCLLACVDAGLTVSDTIAHASRITGSLSDAMLAIIQEMLCPPPTIAMALMVVLHPQITTAALRISQRLVMRHGARHVQQCMAEFMSKPVMISTAMHHKDLMTIAQAALISFELHPSTGLLQLPCGVNLICSATDHTLLVLFAIEYQSSFASNLLRHLDVVTCSEREGFWHTVGEAIESTQ